MPFISCPAKIIEIIDFAPGEVRAVRLKIPDDVEVNARPGNAFFLQLLGKSGPEPQKRAYSFSSVPRSPIIETVISKAAKNPDTSWAFQEFPLGIELKARIEIKDNKKSLFINPRKDLELEPDNWWQGKKFLFYGLGTGVTPHLSALRYMAEQNMPTDIIYVSSSKTFKRLIFHEELQRLANNFPGKFNYMPFLTSENAIGWLYFTGRPILEALTKLIPDIDERHLRICGGKGTRKNFEEDAKKIGITFPSIRYEEW